MGRHLALALTLLAILWIAILFTAPLLTSRGGTSPWLAAVYTGAGLVCHQRPARSFTIAGTQLPVCARCVGLYAAGAAGALVAFAAGATRVRAGGGALRIALALAAAPTAITVAVEWLGRAFPSNVVRAMAAVPLGAAAGWIFVQLLLQNEVAEPSRPLRTP